MNIKACGEPHNFAKLIIYPVSSIAWPSKSANRSKLGAGLEVKYHITAEHELRQEQHPP